MYLNLVYKLLPHPYAFELIWDHERWCELKLEVLDDKLNVVKTIFDWQWDICVLLNWILNNEESIRNEIAPKEIENDFSIAKGIDDFYDKVDVDKDDDKLDLIYDYRTRHGITFALRGIGVDVNNLYIGLHNNSMTISYYNENESWNYEIDAEKFFSDIKNISKVVNCPPCE